MIKSPILQTTKKQTSKWKFWKLKGEPPLPKVNHRFGNRVPQISVKVEEKWKRDDFTPIPEMIDIGGADYGESNHGKLTINDPNPARGAGTSHF